MESGGSQWKVTADDVIYHNKIPGAHVNDVLEFNKVLLLGTREDTTIGRPFVPGASVVAAVEENFKDAQVRAVAGHNLPGWLHMRRRVSTPTHLQPAVWSCRKPHGRVSDTLSRLGAACRLVLCCFAGLATGICVQEEGAQALQQAAGPPQPHHSPAHPGGQAATVRGSSTGSQHIDSSSSSRQQRLTDWCEPAASSPGRHQQQAVTTPAEAGTAKQQADRSSASRSNTGGAGHGSSRAGRTARENAA